MQSEQGKIEGKFYPLKNEELLEANKRLSPRAIIVMLHIRSLDPYRNGLYLKTADIAKDLDISRSTASRALKELDAAGYMDCEILEALVHVNDTGLGHPLAKTTTSDDQGTLTNRTEATKRGRGFGKNTHSARQKCTAEITDSERINSESCTALVKNDASEAEKTSEIDKSLTQSGSYPSKINKTDQENNVYLHTHESEPEEESKQTSSLPVNPSQAFVPKYDPKLGINIPGGAAQGGRRAYQQQRAMQAVQPSLAPTQIQTTPAPTPQAQQPASQPGTKIIPGPWLDEAGKLNKAFVAHIVKMWKSSPTASFHLMSDPDVAALVHRHFIKDPVSLETKWEAYAAVSYQHAENLCQAKLAGINLTDTDKAKLAANANAIAYVASTPQEEWTLPVAPALAGNQVNSLPQPAQLQPATQTVATLAVSQEPVVSVQPVVNFPPEVAQLTPEECSNNMKRLAEMLRGAGKRMQKQDAEVRTAKAFPSSLTEAKEWLNDRILNKAAGEWAKRNGFGLVQDGSGWVAEILMPETC